MVYIYAYHIDLSIKDEFHNPHTKAMQPWGLPYPKKNISIYYSNTVSNRIVFSLGGIVWR